MTAIQLMDYSQRLQQYRTFYKKDVFCGPLLEHKGWNVSRYAVLCSNARIPFHVNVNKCLNFPNNYTKLVRENEKSQQYLWEALLKTYPASKLISKFKEWAKNNISEDLQSLNFSSISNCAGLPSGKIINYVDIPDCYEDKEHPGTLTFYVPIRHGDDSESIALGLADFLYVCGYNLANVSTMDIPSNRTDVDVVAVTFEAKFSDITFEFSKHLYHVALASSLKKICRQGLVPKSSNDVFKYPERVYLFNNAPIAVITSYAIEKAQCKGKKQFALLRISADKLKSCSQYKSGNMRFFIDQKYPNVDNSVPDAIYTYNNVPRHLIDDEFAVYRFDDGIVVDVKHASFNELEDFNEERFGTQT